MATFIDTERSYPQGLFFLSCAPDLDLQQVQKRDRDSNLPLWKVSVLDWAGRQNQRELTVKVPAAQPPDFQGMTRVEFEGLQVGAYASRDEGRLYYRAEYVRAHDSATASNGRTAKAA